MEDDGDATELLQRIQAALLSGGYYRAGISSLSTFDKLTGGLAWCITASNVDVDFDIFFDDDATLGDKIKVGEAIESALQRMKCPFPLQAHQIQGLDFKAVLPVVQWLVKRVQATRQELGDQLRRYALFWFREFCDVNDGAPTQTATTLRKMEAMAPSRQASRLYRRAKNTRPPTNRMNRLRYTLLEYGHQISRVDMASVDQPMLEEWTEAEDILPISANVAPGSAGYVADFTQSLADLSIANDGTLSSNTVRQIVELGSEDIQAASTKYSQPADASKADRYQQILSLKKQVEMQTARISHAQAERESGEKALQVIQQKLKMQDERKAVAQAEIKSLQAQVDAAKAGQTVKELMSLFQQITVLEQREIQFRISSRQARAGLLSEIKLLKGQVAHSAEDTKRTVEIEAACKVDLDKLKALRVELGAKNRVVALLQRRMDDFPTQTELVQYERRFVELFLHIQRKLWETRKYFATYNALAEAHEITMKETSLLNSIHSQFDAAMLTSGGRAKFLESMEGISNGVHQKLDKIVKRFQAEQLTYLSLKEKHSSLVGQQRQYVALIKLFQEECARNEKLHALLEQRRQT